MEGYWPRLGDPVLSDSSSDRTMSQHGDKPPRCSGAAGDAVSHSQLGPHGQLRQQRPGRPADCVTALLNRASVLLSQNCQGPSSEPPEGASAIGCGDVRDFLKARAATFHGHVQCPSRSQPAGCPMLQPLQPPAVQPPAVQPPAVQPPAVQPPAVPPPAVQPPAQAWKPHPQPQEQSRPAESDAKSAFSSRTRNFFESTFLTNLPVTAAREASKSPLAETCAPLQMPPVDRVAITLTERSLSSVFRCSGPARSLLPPRNCRAPPQSDRRDCRTAACQTDSVTAASSQSQLPPQPPLPEPSEQHRTVAAGRCITLDRRGSSNRPPRHPLQAGNSHRWAGKEGEERVQQQQQKHQQRKQKSRKEQLQQGQQRFTFQFRCHEAAREAGVLRTVGHRLNSFFCPGGCGGSPGQSALGRAAMVMEETAHWHTTDHWEPSCCLEAAHHLTEPEAALQLTWRARRLETPSPVLLAASPSMNSSLSSCSSDQASDFALFAERQDKQRRRGHSDDSPEPNSHQLLKQRPQRSSFDTPARVATATQPAEVESRMMPSAGGSFNCLLQALGRARQRQLVDSARSTEPCSRGGSRQQQVSHPVRCRIHTCEVACEILSQEEEGDIYDDEEASVDDAVMLEAGICPHDNQSNACGSCFERHDSSDFQISGGTGDPEDDESFGCDGGCGSQKARHRSEALISSVAQSLLDLSHNLQRCVKRIRGTVAELQCGSL